MFRLTYACCLIFLDYCYLENFLVVDKNTFFISIFGYVFYLVQKFHNFILVLIFLNLLSFWFLSLSYYQKTVLIIILLSKNVILS